MSKRLWQAPLRGEYYADDDAHYITDAIDNVIAEIPPVHGRDAKEMADTIAHRVNVHPALVEALEAMIKLCLDHETPSCDPLRTYAGPAPDVVIPFSAGFPVFCNAKAALEAAKGGSDANTE